MLTGGSRPNCMNRNGPISKNKTFLSFLLASIPFVTICFSVGIWDRVYPLVFGLPFNMFWLIAWIPLSSLCLFGVYRLRQNTGVRESSSSTKAGPQ